MDNRIGERAAVVADQSGESACGPLGATSRAKNYDLYWLDQQPRLRERVHMRCHSIGKNLRVLIDSGEPADADMDCCCFFCSATTQLLKSAVNNADGDRKLVHFASHHLHLDVSLKVSAKIDQ